MCCSGLALLTAHMHDPPLLPSSWSLQRFNAQEAQEIEAARACDRVADGMRDFLTPLLLLFCACAHTACRCPRAVRQAHLHQRKWCNLELYHEEMPSDHALCLLPARPTAARRARPRSRRPRRRQTAPGAPTPRPRPPTTRPRPPTTRPRPPAAPTAAARAPRPRPPAAPAMAARRRRPAAATRPRPRRPLAPTRATPPSPCPPRATRRAHALHGGA